MLNVFIEAIRTKQTVRIQYNGLTRTVEPHAVGETSKGNQVVRCFQVAGAHAKPGHEWDLCSVSKMASAQLTGETFGGPRDGYKRGDKQMARIFAEL